MGSFSLLNSVKWRYIGGKSESDALVCNNNGHDYKQNEVPAVYSSI